MARFFNTAGPVDPEHHYVLDPLNRWNLKQVMALVDQRKYFLLHAPRQTGKTTCMYALRDHLNQQGKLRCVYINIEAGEAAREDVAAGMQAILSCLATQAYEQLQDAFVDQNWQAILAKHGPLQAFRMVLSTWCQHSDKPIVLLIDEIDTLVGTTLISVLRQLREGYPGRLKNLFPHNVLLCGLRDIRDWRIRSQYQQEFQQATGGGSPFNIKSNSLRLGDFSQQDIAVLYQQHTDATSQQFAPDVIEQVFAWTQGQPWLVNALAYEACFGIEGGVQPSKTIAVNDMQQAKEVIIQQRETHIEQLLDKLQQPRVHRVIEPILLGVSRPMSGQDVEYVVDLGLLKQSANGALSIANPIYKEVIPRTLSWDFQTAVTPQQPAYVDKTGQLHINQLLTEFQQFFRENSDSWLDQFQYKEAGPHLILQAFLQRIINGGGSIHREYALGRGRTDLLLLWPAGNTAAAIKPPLQQQRIVLELKLLHLKNSIATKQQEGLVQICQYMQHCAATEGHLLLFDRRKGKSWDERIWVRQEPVDNGKTITIWGL